MMMYAFLQRHQEFIPKIYKAEDIALRLIYYINNSQRITGAEVR